MTALPDTITERSWSQALERLEYGTLHFTDPHGKRSTYQGKHQGPEAEFSISDWRVIRNLVARGDVALGEDFIAGLWTTNSIEHLFSLFLMNLEALDRFAHGTRLNRFLLMMYNQFIRRNSKRGSKENIRAHYDVGNEFYALWLDRTMTYSSALFHEPANTLETAQTNKYQRILDTFERDRAEVLEIGCGWGGFAAQAATQSHRVIGLTISPAQHAFASKRLGGGADIRLQDYRDVMAIENTGLYKGLYHILGGLISPMDGIGPGNLNIDSLIERVGKEKEVKEVILALNATMEGETTSFFIFKKLSGYNLILSAIARGISVGDELEYADEATLARSIANRVPFNSFFAVNK